MNRVLQSLRALFLATIFVAGNLVLPEVDVFLDHGLSAPRFQHVVHLERPGGCRDHAEHCVLSRLLSDLGRQAPATVASLPHFDDRTAAPGPFSAPVAGDITPSTYRSRAPPASLA